MAIPDWGKRLSLLNRTTVGVHRGGLSHYKDAWHGLPHWPSRAMEQSEIQDQRQGKASPVPTHQRLKEQGEWFGTPQFIPQRKLKRPFGTHAQDSARCAGILGLFGIQATQCPNHTEWGSNPQVHNGDPPGMARQQGR
jgi:hypothetical protein